MFNSGRKNRVRKIAVSLYVLSVYTVCTGAVAAGLPVERLEVPEGFSIELYAQVENARQLATGEKGTVFVGSRNAGKVHALVDEDGDYKADRTYLIADGLNMPSGVAFKNGRLYVAAVNQILRFDHIESRLSDPPKPVVITSTLPDDEHHGWKYIAFGPDGYLYVPVGVPCNICLSPDPRHGTILKMDPETGEYEIFARGVRNSVGFDWHPVTNQLWFTDNGRDWLGDDLPPDELNRAPAQGLHFGFPYLHGAGLPDPEYGEHARMGEYTKPALELGAHVAPLGMAFYTGRQFPAEYRNRLFIAEHGSWNRSTKSGYRVISVKLNDGRVESVAPFISGWLNEKEQTSWGRPVDVISLPDGSILVSDDFADAIYRITYR
jgi:glucose/arabinose dehydrogenase